MRPRRVIRIRSFRFRIALLAALLSGVVLVLFGSLTLAMLQRINLQGMDKDIRGFAHRHLHEARGPSYWERASDSLRFFLGDEEDNAFILLVRRHDGRVLHRSSNWPEAFSKPPFPPLEAVVETREAQEAAQDLDSKEDQRAEDSLGIEPPFFMDPPPPRHGGGPPGRRQGPDNFLPPPQRGRGPAPFSQRALRSITLNTPDFFSRSLEGVDWRIGLIHSDEFLLVLGLNMNRLNSKMAQVRSALFLSLGIALLFIALGAWWLSQRALKPIEAVTATIKQVKAMGLEQRIAEQNEDVEFSELIAVFNDMMTWLEKSFEQAIRFSADASHELKTPLTVLQAHLEQAISEAEPGSDEQRRYESLAQELQRLKSITKKLLLLSRIDAGELHLNLHPLDLSELVEGIVEDSEILAPSLRIESDIAPELWVMADADLMKQVIQNLAANAIKYNHKGGVIALKLEADEGAVRLLMANSGSGIATEDHGKVFTRFYRGDKSRGRKVAGAGLGLSLGREIIRAHQGELVLEESTTQRTVFSLTLPRSIAPAQLSDESGQGDHGTGSV